METQETWRNRRHRETGDREMQETVGYSRQEYAGDRVM
jgi:hypothetical protein